MAGTHLAQRRRVAKSLAERVAALEAKMGSKTIESQFRQQAELIDRRFADEFRQQAELIDRRFTVEFRQQAELIDRRFTVEFRQQAELIDRLFAQRFHELDEKWNPRFAGIEKDLAIVREGISILLKRRPQ